MLGFEEALGDHVIEEGEHVVEEAGDVEDADGLRVQAQLEPGVGLEQLLQCADAAGQDDEAVAEVGHQLLALVHGIHADHLRGAFVGQFLVGKVVGDHTNDLATGGQRRICHGAHHACVAAAIDDADAALRQGAAAGGGGRHVFGTCSGTGTAVDAKAFHAGE